MRQAEVAAQPREGWVCDDGGTVGRNHLLFQLTGFREAGGEVVGKGLLHVFVVHERLGFFLVGLFKLGDFLAILFADGLDFLSAACVLDGLGGILDEVEILVLYATARAGCKRNYSAMQG